MHPIFRLLLLRKHDHEGAGHVVSCTVRSIDQRHGIGRHVPGERKHGKQARLAARHGPGAKFFIADAHSRFCPAPRDIERGEVCHPQIQVVLLGINADNRRLRNDGQVAFGAACLSKQVVRSGFDDQLSIARLQLGSGLDASREVPGTVGRLRRLRHLEDLVPSTILLDERLQPANATRIAYVNSDGSGLAQGGKCKWEVHSLIDKVYKRKNLEMAWEKVKENRGSGGVDGQTLEAFEAQLVQRLDRLHRELKEDAYRPLPVRQHPIPKGTNPVSTEY